MFSPCPSKLGAYAEFDDPVIETGRGQAPRYIFSFTHGGLKDRFPASMPVVAQFRGQGQINESPGVWNPKFVPATLLLYGDGQQAEEGASPLAGFEASGSTSASETSAFESNLFSDSTPPAFSVLWEDSDSSRQMMDFFPMQLPLPLKSKGRN